MLANKVAFTGITKAGSDDLAVKIADQVADDKLAQKRVKRLLQILLGLNQCADWIVNLVEDAPRGTERLGRVAKLDRALQLKLDPAEGQELFGNLSYSVFANDTRSLREHCTVGWEAVQKGWAGLSDDQKKHFVGQVFIHDKGYPQTTQAALNYRKAEDVDVEDIVLKVLVAETNTDPYTAMGGGSHGGSRGSIIKNGWAKASDKEKDYMWATLIYQIGDAMDTQDGDAVISKLSQKRSQVVNILQNYVPRQAAEEFVDKRGKAAWDKMMG